MPVNNGGKIDAVWQCVGTMLNRTVLYKNVEIYGFI
jgi:hypothetical protein